MFLIDILHAFCTVPQMYSTDFVYITFVININNIIKTTVVTPLNILLTWQQV